MVNGKIFKAKKFKSVCAPCENSHHVFFDCDKYTDDREILFNSLNWLPSNINTDVNLLTKGSDFHNYF